MRLRGQVRFGYVGRLAVLALGVLLGMLFLASRAPAFGPASTSLVSRSSGFGPLPSAADGSSGLGTHAVSGDGRFVVFQSGADDLGVKDGYYHVWVRDLKLGTTRLLDRAGPGGRPGDKGAAQASISADGSKACFTSTSANLAGGVPDPGNSHVYVVTIATGAITLVDRATGPSGAIGTGYAAGCALNATGGRVVFTSSSPNLVAADNNLRSDVFLRDLSTFTTKLVDQRAGVQASLGASDPSINADGTKIAFDTDSSLTNPGGGIGDNNGTTDVYVLDTNFNQTSLISRGDGAAGPVGNGPSTSPSISNTGAVVAFESNATNLVASDSNGQRDVFVRDTGGGTTRLASRAAGAAGALGNQISTMAAISGDGSSVAFRSFATNLLNGVTPPGSEIYVRNLAGHTIDAVSRGQTMALDDGFPESPSVNATGTRVVWDSTGAGLDPASHGEFLEVFETIPSTAHTTTLVSRPDGNGARVDGVNRSELTQGRTISADGRYVVFASAADAVDPAAAGRAMQVFVRDTLTGATTLVSRAGTAGPAGNASSQDPTVSADGSHVAFFSQATNLVPGITSPELYVRNLRTGDLIVASRTDGPLGAPAGGMTRTAGTLSADGNRVAFSTNVDFAPGDNNGHSDIYVRDLAAATTTLVSVGPGGVPGNANSGAPSIDGSGVRVAFESKATNLVGGAPPGYVHVYVRDVVAGTTVLVDRAHGASGAPADGNSTDPEISADGNRIVFRSYGKLTSDASGSPSWAFVRDIRAADTQLASRADGPAGPAATLAPYGHLAISYDGTHVAFPVYVAGLASDPSRGVRQFNERDLARGNTTLLSAANATSSAGANWYAGVEASLNVDGSCGAFEATADNLASPDYDTADFQEVYVRTQTRECPLLAPDTNITSGPSGTLHVPTATFGFSSSEPGSTFMCQLDRGTFKPCGATFTTPALSDGVHQFAVAATDPALNTDPTPAALTFKVEVPPTILAAGFDHKRFRAAKRTTALPARAKRPPIGATLHWTLSEDATMHVTIERRVRGWRSKSHCLAKRPKRASHPSRCIRTLVLGSFTHEAKAGPGTVFFTAHLRGHRKLLPGRYLAKLTATDQSGNQSPPKDLPFSITH